MEQYTPREHSQIVEIYIQQNKSIVKTQRAWRKINKVKSAPSANTLYRLYERFSTDLTAPDFFLGGYLKSKVYVNKPRTLDELKANIRQEIAAISAETLVKTMEKDSGTTRHAGSRRSFKRYHIQKMMYTNLLEPY
ncbi:PREDICTED: uncharacterized protein LOC105152953 [Acromyrmex echinatior]|uniref:uncharacterized protein LOC105152953 n=1 Tax=Acromyrmex echinatior TaxID=103372 RepID=UPI000580EB67|nr:PREDICTED: uncharacterized protein LOC105152953 [Acromyrmex echinatior]